MNLLLPVVFALGVAVAPTNAPSVTRSLQDLGAPDYRTRERAEAELRTLGPAIAPLLQPLADSADPEVQLRARRLLRTIGPDVRAFLAGKGQCRGVADEGEAKWPCVVTVQEFDPVTGAFAGTVEWLSLGALHAIQGKWAGGQLEFRETKFLRRGNALLDCVYTLTPGTGEQAGLLTGRWRDPNTGRGGNVALDLNARP